MWIKSVAFNDINARNVITGVIVKKCYLTKYYFLMYTHSETLSVEHAENRRNLPLARARRKQDQASPVRSQEATTRRTCDTRRDETVRLRKTIQWLEEGARRSREDLANVRTELHEERRAAKIAKREFETALKEARFAEATKYQSIIAELKTR